MNKKIINFNWWSWIFNISNKKKKNKNENTEILKKIDYLKYTKRFSNMIQIYRMKWIIKILYLFFSRNIRVYQLFDTKEQKGNSRVPGWWFKEIGISRLWFSRYESIIDIISIFSINTEEKLKKSDFKFEYSVSENRKLRNIR